MSAHEPAIFVTLGRAQQACASLIKLRDRKGSEMPKAEWRDLTLHRAYRRGQMLGYMIAVRTDSGTRWLTELEVEAYEA